MKKKIKVTIVKRLEVPELSKDVILKEGLLQLLIMGRSSVHQAYVRYLDS